MTDDDLTLEQLWANLRASEERQRGEAAQRAAEKAQATPPHRPSKARHRTKPSEVTRARLSRASRLREREKALANPEASNLSLMRHARNFSQVELAAAANLPLKTVQDADEGRTRPSLRTRARLARVLGCSPEALR